MKLAALSLLPILFLTMAGPFWFWLSIATAFGFALGQLRKLK